MKPISDLFGKTYHLTSKGPTEEYQYLLGEASKFTGTPYIALHQRFERVFGDKPTEQLMSCLREWVYAAEKAENPGRLFNGLVKKYQTTRTARAE